MSGKLRPFADDYPDYGITLGYCIGFLESLANHEEDENKVDPLCKGPKAKRLNKVRDAIQILNEADEQ